MVQKIRWGILGCGGIAGKFAVGLKVVEGSELLAAGSRTRKKAEDFAERFGAERAYGSYEELAADPEVDVIYVATPHVFHMENTLLCIEAGKAVLCEKPFAMNAQQAVQMIESARAKGVFLMEAMWTRFMPATVRVRELLAEGVIGDVRMFEADFGYRFPWEPGSRALNIELGGGGLLDVGIYPLSFASMVFGRRPEKVAGLGYLGTTGVDEQSAFVLKYDAGELAVLSCAIRMQTPGEAVIMGTKGRIRIHAPFWRSRAVTLTLEDGDDVLYQIPYEGNGYNYEAAEVHRCLREGKFESDVMTLDETLSIMQTMDEIRGQLGLKYPCEQET